MNSASKILLSAGLLSLFFGADQVSAQSVLKRKWDRENATINGGETQVETKRTPFKYKTLLKKPKSSGFNACRALISSAFLQLNTKTRVDSTIESPDCAASSGEYTVFLMIKDENGELQTIEHIEQWASDSNSNVESQKDYEIGVNVDLISVKTGLTCECDELKSSENVPE